MKASKVYGIIGQPVEHSFSPSYFNTKFQKLRLPYSYSKFPLASSGEVISLFKDLSALHGVNVTYPFKEDVIQHLDHLDESAKKIQAVNTIVKSNGKLIGFNTDFLGIIKSLHNLNVTKANTVLILGTGGSSKALQFALDTLQIKYSILSRKAGFDFTYSTFPAKSFQAFDLVVNCTPLGMNPFAHLKPDLPYGSLVPNMSLFDLIYQPPVTEFLKQGLKRGCRVQNGKMMLVAQAEASWKIWTKY